jgi:hypothetical protein
MKHQTLRLAATFLGILAAINAIAGVAVSVIIGVGAATAIAKIGFVLGGFLVSAFSAIMLLTVSRLILLLLSMEEHLRQLVAGNKSNTGD